jgi:hypothetical protein
MISNLTGLSITKVKELRKKQDSDWIQRGQTDC